MRVGGYPITAELQGFPTLTRDGLNCWSARRHRQPAAGAPTVQETVTVTAEAPLLERHHVESGRQRRSAPGAGAPGERAQLDGARAAGAGQPNEPRSNAATPLPDRNNGEAREFQLNIDGQQVSADIGTGGQPQFSQDSIAEFQFLSNRFDATMGRSTGVQVNAITKSGSNRFTGLFRGNFRNSSFNAENPVLDRVEPINNQQLSTRSAARSSRTCCTSSRNYEYEREPRTSILNTPYPAFNVALDGTTTRRRAACVSTISSRPRRG